LFLVLVISSFVCVSASYVHQQGTYVTGNKQLRDAVDGALIRLRSTREYSEIIGFTGVLPDSTCTFSLQNYEEEYPFPTNPAGTLLSALQRGYLLVTRPGPDAEPVGDWTKSPPTGPLPTLIRAIARVIGENYNVNLSVQYAFTNNAEGSEATYDLLLSGGADMTDADYSIAGVINVGNHSVARRQVIQFSCPVITSTICLVYNLDLNVTTIDRLRAVSSNNPEMIIAVFGTASVGFAQSAFPDNQIVDYTTFGSNAISRLASDLRTDAVRVVWNFLATDVARFFPDLDGQFGQLDTPVRNVVGYQYRSDQYSPDYSCPSPSPAPPCPTPSATPSPSPTPCFAPSTDGATNINFDFSGLIERYS